MPVGIDVDAPGDGICHHQRRGGQVVHAHLGMDPTLEVAVSRQDGHRAQVLLGNRLGDRLRQGTRVTDTDGAAIAYVVEAELL